MTARLNQGIDAEPIVSVVIAAHNGERYLEDAIESVRRQSITQIEIVIVDDASSDGTSEIVSRVAASDSRIRSIQADVRSAGAARNIGWRSCRSLFIASLDQDDLAEPTRLEKELQFLEAHPDVGVVGSYYHLVDGAGRSIGDRRMACDPVEVTKSLLTDGQAHIALTTAMFRRSVLEQLGGYREIPGTAVEDLDLFLRIAEVCKVANIPEFLGRWRVHGANSSQTVMNMIRWKLAVEEAARCRRAGLPDPLEERSTWEPPSDEELSRLGHTPRDLCQHAFDEHLMWIGLLLSVHDHDHAIEHLGHARRYLDLETPGERTSYLIARSQTEFATRRLVRSALSALSALVREPRAAGRSLAHPVIGGAGRTVYRRLPADGGGVHGRRLREQIVARLNNIG